MAWKHIKTAPRDGTEILLCRARNAAGEPISPLGIFCQVAAWWQGEGQSGDWVVYCSMVRDPRLHFEPTHWMELPSTPLD